MPFPFVLPTTSAFSFAAVFSCPSHPSLLRNASTYRGVVRDTLKRHKRLPPESQAANLGLVVAALQDYLPYLLAVADALSGKTAKTGVRVVPRPHAAGAGANDAALEWRPVLADPRIPGREPPRVKVALAPGSTVAGLAAEVAFALSALGHAYTLQARAALQPLYVVTSVVPVGADQRLAAINAATKSLLSAAGVFLFAATYAESPASQPAAPEISASALRALSALALAEATLLAVLKDDPYPAVVAQDRNEHDREWMYKAPDIPKVRAHLFARLCLAASEHAAAAAAGARGLSGAFLKYLDDLRQTSRAKACRFFAIDADLGGQTGTALAYIQGAMQGLDGTGNSGFMGPTGRGDGDGRKGSLLSRLRKERSEKKEDRRIERGAGWGGDAGRFEEARVLAMLDAKWTKQNDTVNVQRVPASAPLLAQMPSGRDIHVVKAMTAPALDATVLEAMRAPVDPLDELADEDAFGAAAAGDSSDDEPAASVPSAYY